MSKVFPSMHSRLEKPSFFALIPCWLILVGFLPPNMPLLESGLWEQWEISAWLEIAYHVLTGVITLLILKEYLKDEWFMVSTSFRFYLKHIGLTVGLMVGVELILLGTLYHNGLNVVNLLNGLPVAEMYVVHSPWSLITYRPLLGTMALVLFVPIAICGFYYCFSFATLAYKRPWLGYLSIPVITFLPALINILWRQETAQGLGLYFAGLPVHLLACWSYQKTDNVWTPLVSLAATNLLLAVFLLLVFR